MQDVIIRPVQASDNAQLQWLIKTVLTEFGANKPGFAFHDEELNSMYDSYQAADRAYLVAEKNNELIGGVGIGPLAGGDSSLCELKKMYLLPAARGLGLGGALLKAAVTEAKTRNYQSVYLETLSSMTQAIALYTRHGFDSLPKPLGNSGHFSCDVWMLKTI